ncbi:MAG: DNA polymerase II large subunit, partial [Candidatus Nanohaloarchaea archaeon]|nr:DNA polymerase II large subunit [Candidatus Nanohaloarchaea archaeon]
AAVLYRSLRPEETGLDDFEDVVAGVEATLGVEIRDQAPIFLGARMGRPEKAKRRELKGKPQLLFPCGKDEGGRMRNLIRSYREHGTVEAEVLQNYCSSCNRPTHFGYCPYCGDAAEEQRTCPSCGRETKDETCPSCGSETSRYQESEIPLKELLNIAKRNLDMRRLPELLKAPRGVTGKHRHVEPLEKGLLRNKYDLYVNKDGTIRYDSSDLSMTHFRPEEIGTDVETLRELGYEEDVNGDPLEEPDQVVRLKPQDIVVSKNGRNQSGVEYLYRVTRFIDDLLEEFYGLGAFYNLDDSEDIVGELVIGLAPHTSGGIVGRIIGFTEAKGTYAHPYWHTAKRRNADGDEDSVILLMDGLLNFSRQFLPDRRGTRTMDAPLILSTVLNPDEVDDESWNVDVDARYSKAFYEATQEFREPWEIHGEGEDEVTIAENLIEQDNPFAFDYTHETSDVEDAPMQSSYVTLGEMSEKVKTQLELGAKTRPVREHEVAELLLTKHFVPDIKGNLRAFSSQEVQCTSCNHTHRRVPLQGRCRKCGGDLNLTVPEGAIRKYLEPSEEIADNFAISTYKRQQIYMLKRRIQSLFGKEHRQSGLGQFT